MTDSMYLSTTQICQNLNEYYYYLISTIFQLYGLTNRCKLFSIPVAEYASFSHQTVTLKTNLLGLISNLSKYSFKTCTIFLLFLSLHAFTALESDCNHFGIEI